METAVNSRNNHPVRTKQKAIMKKRIWIFIAALFVVACQDQPNQPDAFGNFESDELIISAETNGKLLDFAPEEGATLDTGQFIALVDTMQAALAIQQLAAQKASVETKKLNIAAQTEVLKAQKKNVVTNRNRIAAMLQEGAATRQQMDDVEGQLDVLDKQIASVQTQFSMVSRELDVVKAQQQLAAEQLRKCRVISPARGTVLQTYAQAGEMVTAGKPLLKMADISTLDLRVYVSGAQLSSVKTGQQVTVRIDDGKEGYRELTGKVSWISDEAEFTPKIIQTKEERVKLVYAVKVKVLNDGSLKIGMPGEIRF